MAGVSVSGGDEKAFDFDERRSSEWGAQEDIFSKGLRFFMFIFKELKFAFLKFGKCKNGEVEGCAKQFSIFFSFLFLIGLLKMYMK